MSSNDSHREGKLGKVSLPGPFQRRVGGSALGKLSLGTDESKKAFKEVAYAGTPGALSKNEGNNSDVAVYACAPIKCHNLLTVKWKGGGRTTQKNGQRRSTWWPAAFSVGNRGWERTIGLVACVLALSPTFVGGSGRRKSPLLSRAIGW